MKLSVIIPNYNGEVLLKKNLSATISTIRQEYRGELEVVVVDDGSSDKSIEFLEKFEKKYDWGKAKFLLVQNQYNLGFSKSVNKAVKEATGEILLLLNTDVHPEKDFLGPLLSHFENENVFAVGCLDKSIESGKTVLRGRGLGKWQRGFLVHRAGDTKKSDTLWVSGGSGAFRKKIWDKLGGFNDLYSPFYWEDIDLSYRALKSGYEVLFENKSIVVHEHEEGSIQSSVSRSKVKTTAYRNQFIFVWENATDFGIIISHLLWLPYHFVKALVAGDWLFFRGFGMALCLLPKVYLCRIQYRRAFRKTDAEVIKSFEE